MAGLDRWSAPAPVAGGATRPAVELRQDYDGGPAPMWPDLPEWLVTDDNRQGLSGGTTPWLVIARPVTRRARATGELRQERRVAWIADDDRLAAVALIRPLRTRADGRLEPAGGWSGRPVVRQIAGAEHYEQSWPAGAGDGAGSGAAPEVRLPEHSVDLLPGSLPAKLAGGIEQAYGGRRPPADGDSGWWTETVVAIRTDGTSVFAVRALRAGIDETAARAGGWYVYGCRGQLTAGEVGSAGALTERPVAPQRLAGRLRRALGG